MRTILALLVITTVLVSCGCGKKTVKESPLPTVCRNPVVARGDYSVIVMDGTPSDNVEGAKEITRCLDQFEAYHPELEIVGTPSVMVNGSGTGVVGILIRHHRRPAQERKPDVPVLKGEGWVEPRVPSAEAP